MHVGVVIVGMVGAAGCARVPEGRLPFRESPDFQLVGVTDASGLSAADLNGDHRTDLIVLSGSTHRLLLLLNREGNRFDVKSTNTSTATNFVLGDFNEDGNEDIATISHDHAEVSFFLGTGDGAFKPGTTVVIPATKPHCHMIAAIDINKDK